MKKLIVKIVEKFIPIVNQVQSPSDSDFKFCTFSYYILNHSSTYPTYFFMLFSYSVSSSQIKKYFVYTNLYLMTRASSWF